MSSCGTRTDVTHYCSCTSLALQMQHWTTAATEFMCSLPLCHSHWGARQGGELHLLCSFCPVFCKACHICPSSRAPHGSSRRRRGYILPRGKMGFCECASQYVVNMETASTSRAGMACPAHVHCVRVPAVQSEGWVRLLLLRSPDKYSFKSMLEM